MNNDPNTYFRNLQQIATEQDRARFASLAATFGSALERLPKIGEEIDAFLASEQTLDYISLIDRIEPKLKLAEVFLAQLDTLPDHLKNDDEILAFAQATSSALTTGQLLGVEDKLQALCIAVRKRQEADEARRIQAEKDAERKRAAEAKAKRQQAEDEAKRKEAEDEAKRKRITEAEAQRKQAENEAKRKLAEEEATCKLAKETEREEDQFILIAGVIGGIIGAVFFAFETRWTTFSFDLFSLIGALVIFFIVVFIGFGFGGVAGMTCLRIKKWWMH